MEGLLLSTFISLYSERMRAFRLTALLIPLLVLSSCSLYNDYGQEITYIIPEGSHYSTHEFFTYVSDDTLSFSFRFDESAIYDIGSDQSDINKLFGFAEGSAQNIHTWSARFGWRWYNDQLEILAYAYIDGVRESELLGTLEIGESGTGTITSEDDRYIFTYEDATVVIPKTTPFHSSKKFLSYPYFGGNIAAQHEVTVWATLLP